MIELWMIRHGETDWNTAARVQGWTDVPLNARGLEQARVLGEMLEGIPFHAIVVSDLGRAKKTASVLQEYIRAPLYIHPGLRERRFGSAEGMPRAEMLHRFPDGAPDAETDAQVACRAKHFLQDMKNQFWSGRILCVSHGGLIRQLLALVGHPNLPAVQNTSVSCIRCDGAKWRVVSVNWANHLDLITAAYSKV